MPSFASRNSPNWGFFYVSLAYLFTFTVNNVMLRAKRRTQKLSIEYFTGYAGDSASLGINEIVFGSGE